MHVLVVSYVWCQCCKPECIHETSWQARNLGLEPEWLPGRFVSTDDALKHSKSMLVMATPLQWPEWPIKMFCLLTNHSTNLLNKI